MGAFLLGFHPSRKRRVQGRDDRIERRIDEIHQAFVRQETQYSLRSGKSCEALMHLFQIVAGGKGLKKIYQAARRRPKMFVHVQRLINEIVPDEPDPAAANALQEGLGGQFSEMRTMMQYLFQSFNFRGDENGRPYRDLIQAIGVEEISHVELIATTIARLLDGAPGYKGNQGTPGSGGSTPLSPALSNGNIHHFLVGGQGALPVDSAGNPWSGSYVYNSGNLVLDLLYNLMLEATGRLQKCRIYEMSDQQDTQGHGLLSNCT